MYGRLYKVMFAPDMILVNSILFCLLLLSTNKLMFMVQNKCNEYDFAVTNDKDRHSDFGYVSSDLEKTTLNSYGKSFFCGLYTS